MSLTKVRVLSQGVIAQKILKETTNPVPVWVIGTTSRGIFLSVNRRWVMFLSYEANRGPLTLNLDLCATPLMEITKNSLVVIQQGSILFPQLDIQIDHSCAELWENLLKPNRPLIDSERIKRINTVGEEIYRRRKESGFNSFLPNLLGFEPGEMQINPAGQSSVEVSRLHKAIRRNDFQNAELSRLLGMGPGLTPSGDDLILGFLLALYRYPDVLKPAFDLAQFHKPIVEKAYQKTSLLSANLIECASLGQADERLCLALDGLMTGVLSENQCVELFLSWGNSSGGDAFHGMALAAIQFKMI